jgi:OmpA family protein
MSPRLAALAVAAVLAGCSSRRPVLYPNEALQQAGPDGADRAIGECMELADGYVKGGAGSGQAGRTAKDAAVGGGVGAAAGAVGGAIWGSPGMGAASGAAAGVTAGVINSLFNGSGGPSATYQNYVNTCLAERGYRVIGWE